MANKISNKMKKTQDEIFLTEGDKWYERNKDHISSEHDEILRYLRDANIKIGKVLEVGSSNGWRLHEIGKEFGAECYGIEPSEKAIKAGEKAFPDIKLSRSLSHDLSAFSDGMFDVLIAGFVFCWIDRGKLLQSVSEIDRVLADNGHLIIQDCYPQYPYKVKYHHLPKESIWTYKQAYWEIFTSSNLYKMLFHKEFPYKNEKVMNNKNRCGMAVLKKQLNNYPELTL